MRLDVYLIDNQYFKTRQRAKEAIESGFVKVAGKVALKAGQELKEGQKVEVLIEDFNYVSRGALKLKAALTDFRVKVEGKVCLDVGVATGGFSEVLLEFGAAKVYAVDIGKGQLAPKLLENNKLVFKNNTDARNLLPTDFQEQLDLIVVDVSFISSMSLIPALWTLMNEKTVLILLVKPQFEYGQKHDGVIKDVKVLDRILKKIRLEVREFGLNIEKEIPSPILGKEGNQEFLWLVKKY